MKGVKRQSGNALKDSVLNTVKIPRLQAGEDVKGGKVRYNPHMELITSHTRTDFDSLAAMVAARRLHPDAVLALPGPLGEEVRRYLSGECDNLHIFRQIQTLDLSAVTRLILVDTRQVGRLGAAAACLTNPGLDIHVYDHHPPRPDDIQAQTVHAAPVGATATLMTRLLRERGLIPLPWEASLLLLGVYDNCSGLVSPKTTPEDLCAAAWLLEQRANLETVSRYFSRALTEKQAEIVEQLQQHSHTYQMQGVSIAISWAQYPDYVDDAPQLLQRTMRLDGQKVLFAFLEMHGSLHLFCRSQVPEVNAGWIVRAFGGNGQATEATALLTGMRRTEAEEKLLQILHNSVRPRERAGELMSTPAIAVTAGVSMNEAAGILTRYNFTVLPVTEIAGSLDSGQPPRVLLGIISRTVIEKAIYHALGDVPVSHFMTTGIASLTEEAGLPEIINIIVANRQRLIPVLRGDTLMGVITRTDLLALLLNDPSNIAPDLVRADKHPSVKQGRNLSELMTQRLPKKTIVLLREIGEIARREHCQAFVAGGFVRDLLLGYKNTDIDIVIEGAGIAFAHALARTRGGTVHPHAKFNTATVVLPDGLRLDVASARLEYYDHPVALPTVEQGSIKRDLHRRDFTINAMAIYLNPERFGMLADFYNSQNDLLAHRIQVLHNLSFVEDPTRIYRAIRFESRLGFRIAKNSERLIRNAVRMGLPRQIDGIRCLHELQLILSEENPIPALKRMENFKLFDFLWPDQKPPFRIDRRFLHVLRGTRTALAWLHRLPGSARRTVEPWLAYMLACTSRQNRSDLDRFCRQLEMPDKTRNLLLTQKERAEAVALLLFRQPGIRPSALYWQLRELTEEGLVYLWAIARKSDIRERVRQHLASQRHLKPLLDGAALQGLGYQPGPCFSTMTRRLLEAWLDGEIHTRTEAEALLAREFPRPQAYKP